MLTLRRTRAGAAAVVGVLAGWIAFDFADPRLHDLRDFDGHEVGRLETAMWRSYYEHRPVGLFVELTELLRQQYHLPFWRSCVGAYHAARAAVVFQRGHAQSDYLLVLPDLVDYYALIRHASSTDFDVQRVASLELEWWIVHRERAQHQPGELYQALARLQAEIYRLSEQQLAEHARARGDAMLLRDQRGVNGSSPSEEDWRRIGEMLDQSWMALRRAVAGSLVSKTGQ